MQIGQYVVFTGSMKSSAIDDRVRIVNRLFQDLEVLEEGCDPVSVEKAELQWADGSFAGIQPVMELTVVEPKEKFQITDAQARANINRNGRHNTALPLVSIEQAMIKKGFSEAAAVWLAQNLRTSDKQHEHWEHLAHNLVECTEFEKFAMQSCDEPTDVAVEARISAAHAVVESYIRHYVG